MKSLAAERRIRSILDRSGHFIADAIMFLLALYARLTYKLSNSQWLLAFQNGQLVHRFSIL
jgi:hypothetical protein